MRTLVIGDPQAPFDKLLAVLDRHGALDGDRLADDVVLVSIGDHFDFDVANWRAAGEDGVRFLRWLASHPAAQVRILLGNHDASRVIELGAISDERFAAARAFAQALHGDPARDARFCAAFPELPTAGLAGRDYASFSVAQRELVRELLLAGRFQLALVGELAGRPVLLTHAGVTERELAMLGVPAEPEAVAAALESHLAGAVDEVRADWGAGRATPLSLEPLHVAGVPGEEGGGLLYHRPSHPGRPGARPTSAQRPRRFDPRALPLGLAQIAGHTGHNKCLEELGPWATPRAHGRKHGGIRTLRRTASEVVYDLGVAPPDDEAADLILIDGEIRRVAVEEVELLPLTGLRGE